MRSQGGSQGTGYPGPLCCMSESKGSLKFEFYFEEKVMKHEQLTRDELIELVRKIIDCDGNEEEIDEMTFVLEQNVVDPEITNYIYYDEKTPEEIVDLALAYKPIQL